MSDMVNKDLENPKRRRIRYKGKNPRRFDEKYKEHNPERYGDDVAKIIQSGKTPAGTHRPICVQEILEVLDPHAGQIALDATLGYGGHAREILKRITPKGCLWGIDVDPIEIKRTEARLRALGYAEHELKVRRINFAGTPKLLTEAGGGFDLVLADLGVSSMQLDDPSRGFTFKMEGPLDLRLNPQRGQPASAFLLTLSANDIERILHAYADEPYASGIAKAIFKYRDKLSTTTRLADVVRRALPQHGVLEKEGVDRSIQRTFQALRIAVNDELIILDKFLKILPMCLKPYGRAAILSFHSGEDTRVARSFQEGVTSGLYINRGHDPIRPSRQEQYDNPRSKSAILRWVQRAG